MPPWEKGLRYNTKPVMQSFILIQLIRTTSRVPGMIASQIKLAAAPLFCNILIVQSVEGLNCKRPIQCLASSEILTPPLTARRVCSVYPPAFGAGEGHTRWVERGWGINSSAEDTRHCSVLYICKYFVVQPLEMLL